MAKINIVLADSDELYLNQLINYFIEKTNMFDICSFSSKESLVKYIGSKTNKIDVIAFSEELMNDVIGIADIPAKILLSDGTFSDIKGFEIVNKYQKAEKFVNAILMIYAEKTGRVEAVATGNRRTKIIGVYSPVGGSGKTTMALVLAVCLANMGRQVFYLNYERVNSTAGLLNAAPGGNLSDVLLAVKTKGANVGMRIIANRYTDPAMKINYINPPESALELNELSIAELKKLITEIGALSEFDAVIVDFDNSFSTAKIELLDACDKILTPFSPDVMSVNKIRLFLNEFKMHPEFDSLLAKIHLAANKADTGAMVNIQNSGILNEKPVEITMPISPTFAEIKNLPYAAGGMQGVFAGFIGNVLEFN
jgi:cellulose biosynthesis protein BcsQ